MGLLDRAGMAAVRAADLRFPAGPGLGPDGRTALTVAGYRAHPHGRPAL